MKRHQIFGENLKYYRIKNGLTQKQLAEKIGYTEKSVSKWENDGGLPTVEMLITLSDLFEISLDDLMFEKTAYHYFLGIDGGGTKTLFQLIDENGTVISKIKKGPANPNDIGMDNTITLLKEGIGEACKGIPYSQITMFAGIAGGGLSGDNAKILKHFFSKFGFFAFENGSDIENLIALAAHEKCIFVIMGTGFIVYALNGAHRKRISGWGQLFDDGGSGYALGRDAISAVLCAGDGSGKETLLTTLLEERLGEPAEAHLTKFYQGGKRYIAEFADLVFQAAQKNDPVALEILEKNMIFAANKINTALDALTFPENDAVIPILFSGGISTKSDILFPLIEKYIVKSKFSLKRIKKEPVDGAIRRAQIIYKTTKGE